MAFNGNYVSIDSILQTVRKYPFTEALTKREAAHSLVTLLGLVGATSPLVRTYKDILITTHKGELPTDIMFMHGANNKGDSIRNQGIPMRYANDIYHSALHSDEARAICEGTSIDGSTIESIYPPIQPDDVDNPEDPNWMDNIYVAPSAYTITSYDVQGIYDNSYTINGMSIDCSFPSGWVEIAYDAVKTDDSGFPMIPDHPSLALAFKYFLLKNSAEPAFYRGDVQKHVYHDIETQYNWYVGQASNGLKMPTTDQMESLSNALLRLIPQRGQFMDGWKSSNKEEKFVDRRDIWHNYRR